jgi:hypothetical protein
MGDARRRHFLFDGGKWRWGYDLGAVTFEVSLGSLLGVMRCETMTFIRQLGVMGAFFAIP